MHKFIIRRLKKRTFEVLPELGFKIRTLGIKKLNVTVKKIQNEEQNTSFVKSVIRKAARLALFLRLDVFLLEAHFYTYIRLDESSSAS